MPNSIEYGYKIETSWTISNEAKKYQNWKLISNVVKYSQLLLFNARYCWILTNVEYSSCSLRGAYCWICYFLGSQQIIGGDKSGCSEQFTKVTKKKLWINILTHMLYFPVLQYSIFYLTVYLKPQSVDSASYSRDFYDFLF